MDSPARFNRADSNLASRFSGALLSEDTQAGPKADVTTIPDHTGKQGEGSRTKGYIVGAAPTSENPRRSRRPPSQTEQFHGAIARVLATDNEPSRPGGRETGSGRAFGLGSYARAMKLAVIIAAAGSSSRYAEAVRAADPGALTRSKLEEDLGGRPVLQRTVELFTTLAQVSTIIVAGPAEPEALDAFKLRFGDKLGLLGCKIIAGGKDHRYETVQRALEHIGPEITHIAVHDAARPVCPANLIERVLDAAERFDAVIPGVEVADTLKRCAAEPVADPKADPLAAIFGAAETKSYKAVAQTVDRAGLVAVQTPQVFEAGLLRKAYKQKDLSSTDDSQLIERLGERVVIVPGDVRNIKITRPGDLTMARVIGNFKAPEERPAHLRF